MKSRDLEKTSWTQTSNLLEMVNHIAESNTVNKYRVFVSSGNVSVLLRIRVLCYNIPWNRMMLIYHILDTIFEDTKGIYWLVVSTHLKNFSQIGNLPQIGVKIKNIWNHQPDLICIPVTPRSNQSPHPTIPNQSWPSDWAGRITRTTPGMMSTAGHDPTWTCCGLWIHHLDVASWKWMDQRWSDQWVASPTYKWLVNGF